MEDDDLVRRLATFVRLHAERHARLLGAQTPRGAPAGRLLFGVVGGALGAAGGGVAGGVGGVFGAVGVATWSRLFGRIDAVGATVGLLGSVLGGVAGGVFTGGVGGATCALRPLHGGVGQLAWLVVGATTGGAVGGIFGGEVGGAGGAVGGGLGAALGTRLTAHLVGGVARRFHGDEQSKQEVVDFGEALGPLAEELSAIERACDRVAGGADVQAFGRRAARTLAAVAMAMEWTDPPRAGETARRRSRRVVEELEETNAEAEKLLLQLSKRRRC